MTYETPTKKALEEDGDAADPGLPPSELLVRAPVAPALFDYQEDLAGQMVRVARANAPENVALLALPTGAGKTRTALAAVLTMVSSADARRILWLAPTRELLDQAFVGLRLIWLSTMGPPALMMYRSHVIKDFPAVGEPAIHLATPQMVVARLMTGRGKGLPEFDLVVFDEAHFAEAPTFKEALGALRNRPGRTVPAIGLSATPGRTTEEGTESLVKFFGRRLLTSDLLKPNAIVQLENRGILAKLEFCRIPIEATSAPRPRVVLSRVDLARPIKPLEADTARFRAVVSKVRQLVNEEKVLVFAGSIAHANALALVLEHVGCRARALSARTPLDERRVVLQEFRSGALSVLVNKSLLATGYDCPIVDSVVLTVPMRSPILFEQVVGRASRGEAMGGKARAYIWQLDDNLAIHGRPASYHRYRDFDWG